MLHFLYALGLWYSELLCLRWMTLSFLRANSPQPTGQMARVLLAAFPCLQMFLSQ